MLNRVSGRRILKGCRVALHGCGGALIVMDWELGEVTEEGDPGMARGELRGLSI